MTKELESIFIKLVRELDIVTDEHLETYLKEQRPPEIAKDIVIACFMKEISSPEIDEVRKYLRGLYL